MKDEEFQSCDECGEELTEDDDKDPDGRMCNSCTCFYDSEYGPNAFDGEYEPNFADPGGQSALRAATEDNPRNLPCPTCGEPDKLTPADRARGYQCDSCADEME